ncbi:MAG TPA: phytanoyl-CoA dioxygenase family protein [Lacipirellulaceae bacterium]|nr:phytanoyl-CoA dioxygenase family protein [Lacipirellulaceae bacterium]
MNSRLAPAQTGRTELAMSAGASQLAARGFAILHQALDDGELKAWIHAVQAFEARGEEAPSSRVANHRNLLADAAIRRLATAAPLSEIVTRALGKGGLPVRGILFNKTPSANWNVPWHQDCMIPVLKRIETPRFGPWAVKAGVPHVEAPAEVLERMVTLRLHLDDCFAENGPLRVVPGTHLRGKLHTREIDALVRNGEEDICTTERGGIVVMHPLTLHASSKATRPGQRRVVHLEYAVETLPNGLAWHSFEHDQPQTL